jgi:hypothetical protein
LILKAEWYPSPGGIQDYDYWRYGCIDVSVEMYCCLNPPASELSQVWTENKKSMIEYLKMAHTGVKGIVSFQDGTRAKRVTVKVQTREPFQKTDQEGEFYKILLPGKYTLRVAFECEDVYQSTFEVPSGSRLLELNITLHNSYINKYRKLNLDQYGAFCSSGSQTHLTSMYTFLVAVLMVILR